MKKKPFAAAAAAALVVAGGLSACTSKADTASTNLSKEADAFQIQRKIVFYNGITGDVIAEVDGRCSLGNFDGPKQLSVTCEVAPGQYEKHFLGLSDNVTYFAIQTSPAAVSAYHTEFILRPSTIVPDFKVDLGG